jgi:DNA polymerase III alpha subunit
VNDSQKKVKPSLESLLKDSQVLTGKDLLQKAKAKELELSHVALTDFCNLYGAVEFYKTVKQKGIKPIIGIELMVAPTDRREKKRIHGAQAGYPIVLLAKKTQLDDSLVVHTVCVGVVASEIFQISED